jgi:hypothetical protein
MNKQDKIQMGALGLLILIAVGVWMAIPYIKNETRFMNKCNVYYQNEMIKRGCIIVPNNGSIAGLTMLPNGSIRWVEYQLNVSGLNKTS